MYQSNITDILVKSQISPRHKAKILFYVQAMHPHFMILIMSKYETPNLRWHSSLMLAGRVGRDAEEPGNIYSNDHSYESLPSFKIFIVNCLFYLDLIACF